MKSQKKAFEPGVSVFEMGQDGLPILRNMNQAASLACRIGYKIYQVTGNEVGTGHDGEPLIRNIRVEKSRRINDESLIHHILTFLSEHFMLVIPPDADYKHEGEYKILQFYNEYQVNLSTGEIKERFFGPDDGFVKIPGHTKFSFYGWEFHFPVDGFGAEPV